MLVFALNVVAEEMLPVDTVKYRRDKAADMYIEYQDRAQFPGGESALIKYVKEIKANINNLAAKYETTTVDTAVEDELAALKAALGK